MLRDTDIVDIRIYALSLVLYDEYMHKYFDDFNLHSYKTMYKPGENWRGLKKSAVQTGEA